MPVLPRLLTQTGSRCWSWAPARRRRLPAWRGRPALPQSCAPTSPGPRAPWCFGGCHEKTVWQRGAGSLACRAAGSAAGGSPQAPRPFSFRDAVGGVARRNQCRWMEAGRGAPRDACGMTRASQQPPAGQQMRRRDSNSMNMKRMRGRGHRPGGGGGGGGGGMRHHGGGGSGSIPLNRNHVFDSNGPDLRIRGTSQQLFEKYLQLGRDATSGGDRVMAESYFQHAEHYFRILNAMNQAAQQNQQNGQQHAAPAPAVSARTASRSTARPRRPRSGRPAPATSPRRARSRSPRRRPRPDQALVQPRPAADRRGPVIAVSPTRRASIAA